MKHNQKGEPIEPEAVRKQCWSMCVHTYTESQARTCHYVSTEGLYGYWYVHTVNIGTVLGPLWQLQEQEGRRRMRRQEDLEKREEKV